MRHLGLICLFLAIGLGSIAAQEKARSRLQSVEVKRPNIVIRGAHLDRVEVWKIPTGTGITPDEYEHLGNATRTGQAGADETWIFPIPSCSNDQSIMATEVFAKGYDAKGTLIGKKSLPDIVASAILRALCGVE